MKRIIVACVLQSAILAAPSPVVGQPTASNIERYADSRRSKVKSLAISLEAKATYPAGSISKLLTVENRGQTSPAEPQSLIYKSEVIFLDNRIRIDEDGHRWSKDKFVRGKTITSMFNGGKQEYIEGVSKTSSGNITQTTDYSMAQMPMYRPILHHYRGNRSKSNAAALYSIHDLVHSGQAAIIDETICEPFATQNLSNRKYWLAPDKEWSLLREVTSLEGLVTTTIDVKYEHASDGLVPIRWVIQDVYPDQSLGKRIEVSVVKYSINPNLSERDFDIAFPPNTQIFEFGDKSKGLGLRTIKKVEEDGTITNVPFLPQEKTYKWQLVVSLIVMSVIAITIFTIRRYRAGNNRQ